MGLTEYTGWKSVRADRYRYVAEANGKESLFDLDLDPHEYHDVAGDAAYRDALMEMRRALIQRLIAMERPIPKTWAY